MKINGNLGGIRSIQSGVMTGNFGSDVVVPINKVNPVKSRLTFYWNGEGAAEMNSFIVDHVLSEESFSLNLAPGDSSIQIYTSTSVNVSNAIWELVEYA